MHNFWYNYVKPKYGENAEFCYMNTESFIVHVKIDDIFKNIEEDVEIRFYTSNYELNRPLPKRRNENVIALIKYKLGAESLKLIFSLRAKTYSYLIDDGRNDKKATGMKKLHLKKLNLKIMKIV